VVALTEGKKKLTAATAALEAHLIAANAAHSSGHLLQAIMYSHAFQEHITFLHVYTHLKTSNAHDQSQYKAFADERTMPFMQTHGIFTPALQLRHGVDTFVTNASSGSDVNPAHGNNSNTSGSGINLVSSNNIDPFDL